MALPALPMYGTPTLKCGPVLQTLTVGNFAHRKDATSHVSRSQLDSNLILPWGHCPLTRQKCRPVHVKQASAAQSSQSWIDHPNREELTQLALDRLAEQDLETAADKYDLWEELYAEIDFAQINAFSEKAFSGNPAAVCYLPIERDAEWMHLVAREFNLPATAFLTRRREKKAGRSARLPGGTGSGGGGDGGGSEASPPSPKGFGPPLLERAAGGGKEVKAVKRVVGRQPLTGNEYDLRWFSSKGELRVCGHGTMAAAHLIFSTGLIETDNIVFHTKSGVLRARLLPPLPRGSRPAPEADGGPRQEGGGSGGGGGGGGDEDSPLVKRRPPARSRIELDFAAEPWHMSTSDRNIVRDALGVLDTTFVGRSTLNDLIVELKSVEEVMAVKPDISKLILLPARGVCVTTAAAEGADYDYMARYFSPIDAIVEHPVTGSAHCSVGPYWAEKLQKSSLVAFQASERGGYLQIRVDSEAGRVYITGSAVTVMAGVLLNTTTNLHQS